MTLAWVSAIALLVQAVDVDPLSARDVDGKKVVIKGNGTINGDNTKTDEESVKTDANFPGKASVFHGGKRKPFKNTPRRPEFDAPTVTGTDGTNNGEHAGKRTRTRADGVTKIEFKGTTVAHGNEELSKGHWWFTEGEKRYKGIMGVGRYTQSILNGIVTYTMVGVYELPDPAPPAPTAISVSAFDDDLSEHGDEDGDGGQDNCFPCMWYSGGCNKLCYVQGAPVWKSCSLCQCCPDENIPNCDYCW